MQPSTALLLVDMTPTAGHPFIPSKLLCLLVGNNVSRSRADTRVITIVDLEGGIRDVFPEELAKEAARAGNEALVTLSGGPAADGEPADGQVRLCVRRLQGTRTLLRKNFRVSPGSLLFTVFTRACERLRIKESNVIFVHDGVILSGRQNAGTLLLTGRRTVQVFAVCKRAWACKQRAAARRGLVSASHEAHGAVAGSGSGFAENLAVLKGGVPYKKHAHSSSAAHRSYSYIIYSAGRLTALNFARKTTFVVALACFNARPANGLSRG